MTVKIAAENLEAKLPVLVEATGDMGLPGEVQAEVTRVCGSYGR